MSSLFEKELLLVNGAHFGTVLQNIKLKQNDSASYTHDESLRK